MSDLKSSENNVHFKNARSLFASDNLKDFEFGAYQK